MGGEGGLYKFPTLQASFLDYWTFAVSASLHNFNLTRRLISRSVPLQLTRSIPFAYAQWLEIIGVASGNFILAIRPSHCQQDVPLHRPTSNPPSWKDQENKKERSDEEHSTPHAAANQPISALPKDPQPDATTPNPIKSIARRGLLAALNIPSVVLLSPPWEGPDDVLGERSSFVIHRAS
ncbi:MAG: hypothetical protein M4579_005809 [Chaenotheca gracillima]|nr:MAG: hypothetical protein M4579_005809 [Chaenotheca gracillima]